MMGRIPQGLFIMPNRDRRRDVAGHSANPEAGAKRVLLADAGACSIGPSGERWDVVQMVRDPSLQAFMALMSGPEIQNDLLHRFAMFEDSGVIPMLERSPGS